MTTYDIVKRVIRETELFNPRSGRRTHRKAVRLRKQANKWLRVNGTVKALRVSP